MYSICLSVDAVTTTTFPDIQEKGGGGGKPQKLESINYRPLSIL